LATISLQVTQAHEEVDFEAADPEVLREDRVAARDKEIARQRLGFLAYVSATRCASPDRL